MVGKASGEIGKTLTKAVVTNAGRLSKGSKAVVKALGGKVTRAATAKTVIKANAGTVSKTVESSMKATTSAARDRVKTKK